MDFIEDVLNMSFNSKRKDSFSSFMALIFFFAFGILSFILFNSSKHYILIFCIGLFIAPLIGFLLGCKISSIIFKKYRKIKFQNSKLYKKIKESGELLLFVGTIDEEMKLESAIKYSCDFMGVGLIVTKTWFVYIDISQPFVVKTEDILKISEETSALCLELKNNKCLRMNGMSYDDIESEIKVKYPNIMIGIGIIDEE